LIVDSGPLTVASQLDSLSRARLTRLSPQQPPLQQGLHVAAPIQQAVDFDCLIRCAIDYPIRLGACGKAP
jgi:hypothetical protein